MLELTPCGILWSSIAALILGGLAMVLFAPAINRSLSMFNRAVATIARSNRHADTLVRVAVMAVALLVAGLSASAALSHTKVVPCHGDTTASSGPVDRHLLAMCETASTPRAN